MCRKLIITQGLDRKMVHVNKLVEPGMVLNLAIKPDNLSTVNLSTVKRSTYVKKGFYNKPNSSPK